MLYTIIVGIIAGWLAGQVMRGGGYGVIVDLLLGLVGGLVERVDFKINVVAQHPAPRAIARETVERRQ